MTAGVSVETERRSYRDGFSPVCQSDFVILYGVSSVIPTAVHCELR